MRKPLPRSIAELRVPNPGFDYFEGAQRLPFRPTAPGFDLVGAWWLAELAFVVYLREPSDVAERVLAAGFEGVRVIEHKGVRCAVARTADHAVACFRGTDVTEARNVLADLEFKLTRWDGGGRVHRGFLRALDQVWPQLDRELERLAPTRRIWFTGHSLGAALATLAAARFGRAKGLYTFGSPRVGDGEFAAGLGGAASWRLVNNRDVITYLPPPLLYRHLARTMLIAADGTLASGDDGRGRDWRDLLARARQAADVRTALGELVSANALAEHAPINYAVHLWNALVDAGRV